MKGGCTCLELSSLVWGLDEGGMLATGTVSDMEEEEEETLLSTLSLWWGWAVLLLAARIISFFQ